jgi:hypothetical protein
VLDDHLRWFRPVEVSNCYCYRGVLGGSLGKEIRLEAERSGSEDSTSDSGRGLSLLHSVKIVSGSHRASYSMVTECSVPKVKRPVRESN